MVYLPWEASLAPHPRLHGILLLCTSHGEHLTAVPPPLLHLDPSLDTKLLQAGTGGDLHMSSAYKQLVLNEGTTGLTVSHLQGQGTFHNKDA